MRDELTACDEEWGTIVSQEWLLCRYEKERRAVAYRSLALVRAIRVGAPLAGVRCVEAANERFAAAVQLPLHGGETGRTGCRRHVGGWEGGWSQTDIEKWKGGKEKIRYR